jgi:hypothetical protein
MKQPDGVTHSDKFSTPEYSRRFRNQATGIGQSRSASEMTGAARSARVVDCGPSTVSKQVAEATGYPQPMPDSMCGVAPMPMQTSLRRAQR